MVEIGLIGKPNAGKSTFFYASTLKPVEISDRPFTTIEPNVGIAFVKQKCVHVDLCLKSCNPQDGFCLKGYRFIPIQLYDIAGLVPDAHKGRGLGNKFLDDIRQVEGFILVLDGSGLTDQEGNYTQKSYENIKKDYEFLIKELDEWYYQVIKRNWEKIVKDIKLKGEDPILVLEKYLSGLNIGKTQIEEVLNKIGKNILNFSEEDIRNFAIELRKQKKFVVAFNKIDYPWAEDCYKEFTKEFKIKTIPTSAYAELILKKLHNEGKIFYIPGSSEFEILKDLDKKEREALNFIEENILKKYKSTGVQNVLNSLVFEKLKYIVVYPVANDKFTDNKGNILPNAFLMKEGSTLLDLAYKIHSDMAKKLIRGVELKSKRTIGKDYVLKNKDVIKIVFGK